VWATVSALMCLVCPVLLCYVSVKHVLFLRTNKWNGMEWYGMLMEIDTCVCVRACVRVGMNWDERLVL